MQQLHPLENATLYDRIGAENLRALLERFYAQVAVHPTLIPLFPTDLSQTIEKQEAFLTGFLGGPPLYFERYGHPRLRMRHMPFAIGVPEAQAWLDCMALALQQSPEIQPATAHELLEALRRTAAHMINRPPA